MQLNPSLHSQFTYSDPEKNHYYLKKSELDEISRSEYRTHFPNQKSAELSYQIANAFFIPWKTTLSLMSRVVQPLPGQGKEHPIKGLFIQVGSFIGFIASIIPSAAIAALGLPFHAYSHGKRPIVGYIKNYSNKHGPTPPNQLTLRTHNVALVHNFMRISNDLRDVQVRANELADAILKDDKAPNVMCLQETFNEEATKILCDRLKEKYPYIIHSLAPHFSGFNSGLMILSQYPIEEVSYHRFDKSLGEENLATKGLLGARIKVGNDKYVQVYNVHTQGLPGHKRAKIRHEQLKQALKWIDEDQKESQAQNKTPPSRTVLLGDFNISKISAWGEFNDEENDNFKLLKERFHNIIEKDHDPITLERTSGKRMFNDGKPENHGTWENGPFPQKPLIFRIQDWLYRKWNHIPPKKKYEGIASDSSKWGYQNQWKQSATPACFDYILSLKEKQEPSLKLNDRAEIRRIDSPTAKLSGISDHLPIDAVIDI